MKLSPEKMDIVGVYEGKSSSSGWLVLDISKLDLDGINKLYINLDDVESMKQTKGEQADALTQAKKLLGGL